VYYYSAGRSCNLLANILRAQVKLGDETKRLYERYLVISIRHEGPDGSNIAIGNNHLGLFHFKLAYEQATVDLQRKQLLLAKSYFEEALRIYSKIDGPIHLDTVKASSLLDVALSELSQISPN
jgi:hypothetical protein